MRKGSRYHQDMQGSIYYIQNTPEPSQLWRKYRSWKHHVEPFAIILCISGELSHGNPWKFREKLCREEDPKSRVVELCQISLMIKFCAWGSYETCVPDLHKSIMEFLSQLWRQGLTYLVEFCWPDGKSNFDEVWGHARGLIANLARRVFREDIKCSVLWRDWVMGLCDVVFR